MEDKALTIHSEGMIILSKIDLSHTNSFRRIYNECNCKPMCDPIDGWMIRYELFNSENLKSVVNEFCNLLEKNEVEYDFTCYFNNDKTIVNVWILNNKIAYKCKARRVFKWNNKLIHVSNAKSLVVLSNEEMIEGIKYGDVSILSVFTQQLN